MGLRVLFGKDFGARRHEKSMQLEVEHEQKTLKSLSTPSKNGPTN